MDRTMNHDIGTVVVALLNAFVAKSPVAEWPAMKVYFRIVLRIQVTDTRALSWEVQALCSDLITLQLATPTILHYNRPRFFRLHASRLGTLRRCLLWPFRCATVPRSPNRQNCFLCRRKAHGVHICGYEAASTQANGRIA